MNIKKEIIMSFMREGKVPSISYHEYNKNFSVYFKKKYGYGIQASFTKEELDSLGFSSLANTLIKITQDKEKQLNLPL